MHMLRDAVTSPGKVQERNVARAMPTSAQPALPSALAMPTAAQHGADVPSTPGPLHAVLASDAAPSPAEDWERRVAGYFTAMHGCEGTSRRPSLMVPGQVGLFADRSFKKGEVVCEEVPLVASQLVRNRHRVLACGSCLAFVGGLEQQLDLLSGEVNAAEVGSSPASWRLSWTGPDASADSKQAIGATDAIVKCRCGETFCSRSCLETSGHRYICVAELDEKSAEDSPLWRFKAHAMQTSELYLLGGRVLAWLMHRASELQNVVDTLTPLAGMIGQPLWEFAAPPAGEEPKGGTSEYRAKLKEECRESFSLLSEYFLFGSAKPVAELLQGAGVLTYQFWGRLLGSFQMNNFAVVVASPLKRYISDLAQRLKERAAEQSPTCHKLTEAAAQMEGKGAAILKQHAGEDHLDAVHVDKPAVEDLLDSEDIFAPPLDGLGVFPRMALANHSCDPCAEMVFGDSTGTSGGGVKLTLVALRPIAAGEELVHSYIDTRLPLASRTRQLFDSYGFVCRCRRCQPVIAPCAAAAGAATRDAGGASERAAGRKRAKLK